MEGQSVSLVLFFMVNVQIKPISSAVAPYFDSLVQRACSYEVLFYADVKPADLPRVEWENEEIVAQEIRFCQSFEVNSHFDDLVVVSR